MTLIDAIRNLLDYHHIADNIYEARSKARELDDYDGEDSWDSPRVKNYSECIEALEREIKGR